MIRTRAVCFLLMCLFFTTSVYFLFFPFVNKKRSTIRVSNIKYILYWTPFWWHKDFEIGFGHTPFQNCEYKNCFATNSKTLLQIEEYDAIIFHASIYDEAQHGKPSSRSPEQMYIFANVEAPTYISPNLKKFNSFFNWTMTYRFDSDVVARHGRFVEEEVNYTLPSADVIKNKTKLISWFVSHCNTSSKRELLAKGMQKHLSVDVYGTCGPLKCEKIQFNELSSPKCYDMIEENYKFYLSFENSLCKDYSTEKLYNVLRKNIVPIVYGAGDYKLSAPPYSVINVAEYGTVKQLTDYLMYLDNNVTEYLKYFEWKKHYKIVRSTKACDICKKLNQPLNKSIYHDLHAWSWGESNEVCTTGKGLPSIVKDLT